MTVSYTYGRPDRVSEQSRAKVLAAAARLGYPGPDPSARSLRYGATRTLGVVLGEHLTYAFDDRQAVAFLAGVAEVCAERGYGLLIVPTGAGDDDRARAVGAEVFAGARRPAVLSFPIDRSRDTFVRAGLDPDEVAYPVTHDRLAGYRDAARDLGLDWAQVPVGVCPTNDVEQARTVVRQLLEVAPDLDAVAAMGDQLALAVRLESDALRVSGWDDSDVAREHGFTTVAQSLREQGAACALAALGGPVADHRDAWQLVRRASTSS
jgi:DNA-binding LacI/PurR family transcriptional regulator